MKRLFSILKKVPASLTFALLVAIVVATIALADGLQGDALVSTPGNQDVKNETIPGGGFVSYEFGALISDTGGTSDNVFAASGDSLTVTIARTGDWLDAASGSPGSFTFSAYGAQQTGTINILVPCNTEGTLKEMTVTLTAGASTNGKLLDVQKRVVVLKYRITAGPNGSNCQAVNNPPTAAFDWSPKPQNEGSAVSFTDQSTDSDGTIVSWSWDFDGLGTSSDQNPSFTFMDNGIYNVCLTVTDDDGSSNEACHDVTITDLAPTASFEWNPEPQDEGSPVSFTDTSTSYPDAIVSWSWDFDDSAGSSSDQNPSYAFTDDGSYNVCLTVTDDDGSTDSECHEVTIENVAPLVATPSWTNTTVQCRASATLTGISFSDPGVVDFPWQVSINWQDGPTTDYSTNSQGAQGPQSHTYNAPGNYTATVTVTDKDGGVGSSSTAVAIDVQQTYTLDFLPPFDDSTPSGLIVNKMKNGRVVPVKVVIYDVCAQAYVTNASVAIKVSKVTGSNGLISDPIEQYADAGQSSAGTNFFRWTSDATAPGGGFWIYNLDSKALGLTIGNTYRIDVYVDGKLASGLNWALLAPVK